MAEIRINATGGVKLYDADDSHYAQIVAGTITSNVDAITLGHDVVSIVDNLALTSDSAVLKFGADNDTTLTHTDGTGLTLNSTNKLCFNDASQFVQGSSNAILSLGATDEIDLTATAIDINGTCDISGTFSLGGTNITTTAAEINLIDGGTARGTTALADGDGILINDAGTMRMTNVTAVKTYMATAALAGIDDQSSSNDDQLTITDSAVVINEDSDDLDFRIEGNSLANLFYVDAGEDKIYMGVASKGVVAAGHEPSFYMEGTNDADSTIGLTQNSNNNSGPSFVMTSTRGTSVGAVTIVQDDDYMGNIYWGGADGNDKITYGAQISARVDGAPGENDLPTRLIFATTADGAASPTEHFRIAQNGDLTATDTSIGSNSDSRIKENIADFTYDLAKFKQLQPRTFDWKNPSQHNGASGNRGFIAQEIQAIDDYWIGEIGLDEKFNLDDDGNWIKVMSDYDLIPVGEKALTSKLGKKDAMYISVINQLITRIEALEG